MRPSNPSDDWLATVRAYLALSAGLHLAWEVIQLPFYTLWQTGARGDIAFAVVHCTVGDLMIATLTLVIALVAFGRNGWPVTGFTSVVAATLMLGVGYTVYSELINTVVRKSWGYSDIMPTPPWLGTGVTPLLQWLIVPSIAFILADPARLGSVKLGAFRGQDQR